jgi:hypothetical protein
MARVGNSIFDIQSKLGDLVYYRYRGQLMVKKASSRKRNNPTECQQERQAKFALMVNFLGSLRDFFKVTYKEYNRNKTGYQKAFKENYHTAITGSYPSFSIDYSKVRLGNGTLSHVTDTSVHSPDPGKLVFSWGESDNSHRSLSSDQFYVALYSEKLKLWIFKFENAERCKKFCRVDAGHFSGTRVHIYNGFVSADGKQASTPLYTGALTIS